jgi:drug/metabolite transporter, DME family
VFLTRAVRRLPALEVSLLLLLEPTLNPWWTWLFRGEHPGAWTISGGAIIIALTAIRSLYETFETRADRAIASSGSE